MIVCPHHQETYLSPMIQTFAFMGAECWCPYCDHSAGLPFGDVERVDDTPELEKRYELYRVAAGEYLHAIGVRSCSRTTWPHGSGIAIPPDQLPEEEKQRLAAIRAKGWPKNVKAEDLAA
jgi:hypothetical protein